MRLALTVREAKIGETKTDPFDVGSASGAEDGIRTRDLLLGKEMLYQLSHFRVLT